MTHGGVFPGGSLTEYFKDLVEEAMVHQQVSADALTSYYLVRLLEGFARADEPPLEGEPLGLRLHQALQSGGRRAGEELREVGDAALFVSGYFSDSLRRSLVDVDYYIALGGYAYGSLRHYGDPELGLVYEELSRRFAVFVDVLTEVSERGMMTTDADLLRLYERWLRTGSRRVGQKLVVRGIVPNQSIGAKFIQ